MGSLTNFPNGLSSFGVPVLPPVSSAVLTGNVWFVNSVGGVNGSGSGSDPSLPLTTLAAAIAAATANNGDVIFMMPGHAETVAAAAGIAVSKAGLTIIGLGSGAQRPTFTFSTLASATMTFAGANTSMRNFVGICNIDQLASAFVVSAAGVFLDFEWQDSASNKEAITVVLGGTAADKIAINMKYLGQTGGSHCVAPIQLNGTDGAIINLDFYGKASTAVVNFITTACTGVEIYGYAYNSGTTDGTKLCVDTIGGSTWFLSVYDGAAGGGMSGGSGQAVASDDVSSISAKLNVPTADASTNTAERDVIGNKADAAVYALGSVASLAAYVKGVLHTNVLATGTFTTSSATVPADTGRTEATNYWNGCRLIPLTGTIAFQQRMITGFNNTGGVFTLDSDMPFTAAPGAVAYVIVGPVTSITPATDSTANTTPAHVGGSKADTAIYAPGTTVSLAAYIKGLTQRGTNMSTVTLANTDFTGTTTRWTIANGPILVRHMGLLITTVLPAGANTLKFQFTPTGGAATDLCGATDTASGAAQQLFVVDGVKATGLVKCTDVGIMVTANEHMPIVLSSGVITTVFSAGPPASGAGLLYIEWESMNRASTLV